MSWRINLYLPECDHLVVELVQCLLVELAQTRPEVFLNGCLDGVSAQALNDGLISIFAQLSSIIKMNCVLVEWFNWLWKAFESILEYEMLCTYNSSRWSCSSSGRGSNGTHPNLTHIRPTFVSTCHKLVKENNVTSYNSRALVRHELSKKKHTSLLDKAEHCWN